MRIRTHSTLFALTVLAFLVGEQIIHAQGTTFTYQGRLNDGTNAANGSYDFQCFLYYAPSGELPLAPPPLPNPAVGVTNGLFTMAISFTGLNPFTGQSLWLELQVRTNGSGSYTTLAPPMRPRRPAPRRPATSPARSRAT